MAANQPSWPRRWLMTDERIGDRLWEAVERLPAGNGGIIFRHYSLSAGERLRLGLELAAAARERQLILGVAGSRRFADVLGASIVHKPDGPTSLPLSLPVHDEAEAESARQQRASLIFISPVHATRSHPHSPALGFERAAELSRLAAQPAIALGGMNLDRFNRLAEAFPGHFHGYAGIDCWLEA